MRLFRSHRRLTTWLALWALVLNALMPLAAHAVVRTAASNDVLEICTSTGMIRVESNVQGAQHSGQPASGYDWSKVCPDCTLHGGVAGMPPAEYAVSFAPPMAEMPSAFYQAQPTSSVWLAARSRAPPVLV